MHGLESVKKSKLRNSTVNVLCFPLSLSLTTDPDIPFTIYSLCPDSKIGEDLA